MRIAFVATPAFLSDQRPAPGALDGDLVRARLSLDDAGFRVLDLDPTTDVAEQLEARFDDLQPQSDALILFYASSTVALSPEGELFFCFDPESPDTGDALGDIAAVFRDRARGSVLFVLECHHPPDPSDPFASASVVAAAKQAVQPPTTGIELLVAAHPLGSTSADMPSTFTRTFVEQLDDADPDRGISAARLYAQIHEDDRLIGAVPCYTYAKGSKPFPLLIAKIESTPPADEPQPDLDAGTTDPQHAIDLSSSALRAPDLPSDLDVDGAITVRTPSPFFPDDDEVPDAKSPYHPEQLQQNAPAHAEDKTIPSPQIEDDVEQRLSPPKPIASDVSTQRAPVTVPAAAPSSPSASVKPVASPTQHKASASVPAPRSPASIPPSKSIPPPKTTATIPPPGESLLRYLVQGDEMVDSGEIEAALVEYKKALGVLEISQKNQRADVYIRIAKAKRKQGKRREAIASFEKALQFLPGHLDAIEAVIELSIEEGDFKGLHAAEEALLTLIDDEEERFKFLIESAQRWEELANDIVKARINYERARQIHQDDLGILNKLLHFHELAGEHDGAFATRRRIAELTKNPRAKAEIYFDLAKIVLENIAESSRLTLSDVTPETGVFELLNLALDADPTMLEPLAIVARLLADRQEWSELEVAYRRMLDRVDRIPKSAVRSEVRFELYRRLALLFRDHLEDPDSALDAFESAIAEKSDDVQIRLQAAELARSSARPERAAPHLQMVAVLEPANIQVFHDLFDVFQKSRCPDQAYAAASVAMHLGVAETRERFIFDEHRPNGVPKLLRALPPEAWDLLRTDDRDPYVDNILAAVTDVAIDAKLAQRASEKRLAQLDPKTRQDPQQSTVSVVRSFAWASHFLGVPAPAIYLREDAAISIASVMTEEPSVIAGGHVLRDRSLPEITFFVARHLAYHVGSNRLLLYFPSIEDLSTCFMAAMKLVRPSLSIPAALEDPTLALVTLLDERLSEDERDTLSLAVIDFNEARARADLAHWAGTVERCAARAGYLLCGSLEIATALVAEDAAGLLSPEEKIGDLYGFVVSDAHHQLREHLGIAIEP